MNLSQMKKNKGLRVRLVPVACRLDDLGMALPELDEDWRIDDVDDDAITLSRTAGHVVKLGPDHVHHFTSDPQSTVGETKFGFLSLHVQVFLQGPNAWVKPNLRPGEPVAPPQISIDDKVVDFNYPTDSGLQRRLEAEGYRLSWRLETHLTRLLTLEGHELVIARTPDGKLSRFRVKDPRIDQVLVKKRVG
jgi:hypothetical protein